MTDSAFGDLGARLEDLGDAAWAHQVHGATALVVEAPGCAGEADALVTATPGLRLAVRAADCGPLVLASTGERPCVGVVHVGWRGARGGVVEAAASALRGLSGSDAVTGWLGPCIRSCCYGFGDEERDQVAAVLGASVRSTTSLGAPALDLPAAVAAAARRAGVELTGSDGRCTACAVDGSGHPVLFSHRARADTARHGVLACLR